MPEGCASTAGLCGGGDRARPTRAQDKDIPRCRSLVINPGRRYGLRWPTGLRANPEARRSAGVAGTYADER